MSNLQNVPVAVVQDYEYGTDGRPLANTEVTVRLAVAQSLVGAGVTGGAPVNLEPIEARVKTDSNGFWSVSLVRNSDITPGGTYYTVKVGLIRQYQIQVPAGAGPFTASAILLGALPFFPSGSSVAGPITITGNLTVTGTGNFAGALTASGGLTVLGGGSVSGGLTVAGPLTMSDTASRLVPGATSFSVRDNGNLNDNLLVSNAGLVTVRNGLVVSAAGASITGDETLNGRLVMSTASAKIVGGATQLSLRDNADANDNVLVSNAGVVTLRNALNVPPSAGGVLGAGLFGTVPVLFAVQTPASGTNVTQAIPNTFRHILICYSVAFSASASLLMQLNGDAGATHYFWAHNDAANDGTRAGSGSPNTGTSSAEVGFVGTGGNLDCAGSVLIKDVQQTSRHIRWSFECSYDNNAAPVFHSLTGHGLWQPTALAALTSVAINMGTITSSNFEFWGYP